LLEAQMKATNALLRDRLSLSVLRAMWRKIKCYVVWNLCLQSARCWQWFLPTVYRNKLVQRSGWFSLLSASLEARRSEEASQAVLFCSPHLLISQCPFQENCKGW
jgi:hypothetical protein